MGRPLPGADPPPAAPSGCAQCGGSLHPRGRRTRGALTPGQPDPAPLDRPYFVCTRCGAGVFPLDEALGLLPEQLSSRLAEGVTRLTSWMPFAQAAEYLAFFWGCV